MPWFDNYDTVDSKLFPIFNDSWIQSRLHTLRGLHNIVLYNPCLVSCPYMNMPLFCDPTIPRVGCGVRTNFSQFLFRAV